MASQAFLSSQFPAVMLTVVLLPVSAAMAWQARHDSTKPNTSTISAFRDFKLMDEGELRRALRTARRSVEAAKATASPEELTRHLISAAQHLVFLMERIIEERKSSGRKEE